MNRYDNPVRLVKELKGAPLSVVIALSLAAQPVSNEWLERNTGYSDKPVAKALAYLQEHQFVIKTHRGWKLSDGAMQLPLPFEQVEKGQQVPDESIVDNSVDNFVDKPAENSDTNGLSRNYSDSENSDSDYPQEISLEKPNSDTNSLSRKNSDSINNIKEVVNLKDSLNNINRPSRKFSDSKDPEGGESIDGDKIELVKRAFRDCGIQVNRRTRQLLTKLSARDVYDAYRRLEFQGKTKETGILITILEDTAEKNARREDEYRQRYAEWEES